MGMDRPMDHHNSKLNPSNSEPCVCLKKEYIYVTLYEVRKNIIRVWYLLQGLKFPVLW